MTITELERNPRFRTLSWEDQKLLRYDAMLENMGGIEGMNALEPMVRARLIDEVLRREPVFADEKVAANYRTILERFKSENPEEKEEAAKQLKTIAGTTSIGSSGVFKTMMGVAGPVAQRIAGVSPGEELTWEQLYGKDARKMVEYSREILDPGDKRVVDNLTKWGGFVSMGLDFLASVAITRGMPTRTASLPFVKFAETKAKTRLSQWLAGSIAPMVIENTGGGIIGAMREQLLRDPDEEVRFGNVLRDFGEYAALDYVIGAALSAVGLGVKAAWKTFRGVDKGLDKLTPAVKEQKIQAFLRGDLDISTFGELSEATQDRLIHARNVQKFAMDPAALGTDTLAQTTVMAHNTGLFMRQMDDGTFRLRSMADTRASKVYADIFETQKAIAAQVDRVAAKISNPDELAQWLQGRGPIAPMVENYKFIRESFDAVSTKGVKTQAYRSTISPGELAADFRKFQELQAQGKIAHVGTYQVSPDSLKMEAVALVKAEGGINNGLVVLRKTALPEQVEQAKRLVKGQVKGGLPEQSLVFSKLASEGFDSYVTPEGTLVHLFPENIKIEGKINPRTGREGSLRVEHMATQEFDPASKIRLKEDILSLTPSKFAKSKETIAEALLELGTGDVDPVKVKGIVEALLAKKRIAPVLVQLDDTIEGLSSMRVRILPGTNETRVIVPSMVSGPETFRVFSKNLLEAVDRQSGTLQDAFKGEFPLKKAVGAQVEGGLRVLPNAPADVQLDWIKRVLRMQGQNLANLPGGKFAVQMANGQSRVYKSLDALAKSIYFQEITKESLAVQLARAGYKMTEEKGLLVVWGKKKGVYWAGTTPEEVLTKMGWSPRRLNAKYAPKVVVEQAGVRLRFEEDVLVGSGMEVRRFLDSFEDFLETEKSRVAHRSPKGVVTQVKDNIYRVEMPRFGIVEEFKTIGEARRFMERDWARFENLQEAASRRGWSLTMDGPNWRVRGADIDVTARNADEVGAVLKMSPDPVYAPPILGEEIEGQLSLFVRDHPFPVGFEVERPRFLTPPDVGLLVPGLRVPSAVAYGTAPMRDFIRLAQENMSNPDNWLKAARLDLAPLTKDRIKVLGQWVRAKSDEAREVLQSAAKITDEELDLVRWVKIASEDKTLFTLTKTLSRQNSLAMSEIMKGNNIFHDMLSPGGKLLSEEKRRGLFWFMGAKDEAGRLAAAEKFGLTVEDLGVADKIREVLGRNRYDGLFAKFGIDPNLFLFDYMPRIRKALETMKPDQINALKYDEFMETVFGKGHVPRELSFFAEHQRLSELAKFALDDDILGVLHKYNSMGHKKLYLNDVWRDTYEYLDSPVGRKLPVAIHQRMNRYRQQIMGIYQSDAEVMVEDFVTRLMLRMGKDGAKSFKAGRELMGKMFSLNYLATMGWRPWLPIRNLFQIFSTLAPRFGNDRTLKALREVVEDADGGIFQVMKNLGIIQDVPPIVHQLANEQSRLGRLTANGLKWYKNSDDITRAISFKTAWNAWDDGVARMKSGVFKGKKEFLEFTQANLLGPETSDMIWDLYSKGKVDEARNLFGFEVQADTMFLYQKAESPTMFQGLVGKLFGQYGTYSANYRQGLWKGLRYGTPVQRAAFVARLAANSAAMYGTFQALGIREKDFLAWTPVGFSGGPLFNAGVTAMQATQDNYKGRQARAELPRYLTTFVPGSYQYRALKEFMVETEKGDSYRAFLALLDFPLVP